MSGPLRARSRGLFLFAVSSLLQLPHLVLGATCGQTHTVVSGEGCWSIYTDANLSEAQFLALNDGLDCSVLSIGQEVCIAPQCSEFYIIQSGDYCYKIETDHGISDSDLLSWNPGLTCDTIFVGQSVCVAAPTATATVTTSAASSTTTPASTSSAPATTTTAAPLPTASCGYSIPVTQGDTCYDLATAHGLQLSQFTALNQDLNCTNLQAGDVACVEIDCGQVYKVQSGDWCAQIESDWSLSDGQLTVMNPGLSCDTLAAQVNVCVEPPIAKNTNTTSVTQTVDSYPALSPGETIPQSPLLTFASVEGNARSTFLGEVIFQSDSQHLAAFTHNDLNGDGLLDHDELQKMMSHDPSVLRGVGEINSTLTAENLVSEMLAAADQNGDGNIDQDEFLFAIRQVQNATNTVVELAADNTAVGQQRKRIIPLIIAGIAAILGLVIADITLFFQILADQEVFRGNDLLSYLDVTYWDTSKARLHLALRICIGRPIAALLGRVMPSLVPMEANDCVTHFNSGSAGCGFLGCKSLCYNYNLDNCSCDALKYEAERDTEYTDTPISTSNEFGVGACRNKCGNTSGCVGFSVSPGSSDTTLTCKLFSSLTNKQSNSKYTTFRLSGSSSDTCPTLETTEFTPWPAAVMADDIESAERFSDAYGKTSLKIRKRAPSSVDRRNDSRYTTTIKNQGATQCGLCAPYSLTTAVEGTHKMMKGGYTGFRDLSPVWVGICKGGQSCEAGKQGGNHEKLLRALGKSYIYAESCVPQSTVRSPNCKSQCDITPAPYISTWRSWNFFSVKEDSLDREYTEQVKEWIANTGPVLASICVGSAFDSYAQSLTSTGPDTVFYDKDSKYKGLPKCGTCNHAITIVGYFEYQRAGQTRLVWIIQNSYGDYGKKGYQFIEHPSAAIRKTSWYGLKVLEGSGHDEL
ncbi:Papain family cysteine protease domain containing protein [Ceratobasidium theobromae]|uniref:Papain family cysteine protease domain containing protein n=1 Tax=Ceratobasidium theobromae TaxID=1582974 RepID=A0A5N5QD46_9AGAM|nr:Papain family cysteine protease domain containing protein [Ceratobasidium theobromae]